ncbi:Iron binding protein IscA for iron-sulfur cluster assembly [uncultured Candidatus Thioglobus sp.]|nr:Iron binding protein IscA for iron-sulfur cluster assembly [uncultured Candidatus Thioglobus sp.]
MNSSTIANGITLTDRAAEHVKHFLTQNAASTGLRLATKTTGCSGYQYIVEIVEKPNNQDEVFESQGIKIFIDSLSLPLLQGIQVDYVHVGLQKEFQFTNPNAKTTCGCGESFSV